MTTLELYNKHQAGEVSREKFLYEVRRDNNLPWITNLTSYNDAVKILKNKGIIKEVFTLKPSEETSLENIISKYVKDADDVSKEMDAYYEKGFKGFSDVVQANLNRDNEFQSWVQRTHDEEQLGKEIGESKLNEDWGSSDQATFNKAIHDDLGQPTEMPMPFDPKFEAAVESAVDFWWDDWDEYATDRDGLIDHAKKAYYRSYFPEKFAGFQQMFSENLNEAKKETKTLDTVNPYEYRHGLAYELDQLDDYSGEGLEKAIAKVLKNLTKDANFYSNLLNQKQSSFEFKKSEVDAKGMQANADGTLKKGAGKLEKANVKDTLGKKEAGKSKPKGVKVMPDKGVEGTQKTIKEGLEEAKTNKYITIEKDEYDEYPTLNSEACEAYLKSVIDPRELKSVDAFMDDEEGWGNAAEYFFEGDIENPSEKDVEDYLEQEMSYYLTSQPDEFPRKSVKEELDVNFEEDNETKFEDLMKKYDWYYEMSDDSRKFDNGKAMDRQLQALGSKIGVDKAVELFNKYAPADRKVTSTFFSINEDKKSKLKELLKNKLKETLSATDIQNAKISGKPINVSKTNTQDIKALQTAKANFTTYE